MRDPLCSFAMRYKSGGMRCETQSCCGTNERACWGRPQGGAKLAGTVRPLLTFSMKLCRCPSAI